MKHGTYDFNQDQTLTHTELKSRTKTLTSSMNLHAIHCDTSWTPFLCWFHKII